MSALIRGARTVALRAGAPHHPVDIRIADGIVREIGSALRPDPDAWVVEAEGRWAAPGLWDQHVHLAQWALVRSRVDLSGAASAEDVVRRVAAHVRALPAGAGGVVSGFGHRTATWPAPPTVAALDAVSGDRPVVLVSGDAHSGWLNSRALALLGVPPRGGPLEETDWFAVFPRLAELPGARADDEAAYRAVVAQAAAAGVVGVTDFEFGPGHRDWPRRFARGVDTLRVRAAVYPEHLDDVIAAGLRTGQALAGGGLVAMGPLKVISDGSLNTRTAHCCEPYADSAGVGRQNVPFDELVALLRRARAAGLAAAVHAIGDAAVAIALDAFAATGVPGSVEHAQLVRRADVARMGRLGVRASVQPAHLLDDRDVTARCWPDRADRCFPLRSLLDAGVPLALGSDAPVAPLDPWLAMAAAVHRSGDDRGPWNPAESLTAAQALAASTDGRTLAPGGPGDVVLLDDDPLRPVGEPGDTAAVAAHLRGVRVAATLVAGRVTHLAL